MDKIALYMGVQYGQVCIISTYNQRNFQALYIQWNLVCPESSNPEISLIEHFYFEKIH